MLKWIKPLIMSVTVFFCFALSAADTAVHFYFDLIANLASDVNKIDSFKYSLGNEMIDSGLFTHPMGLSAARILYHFQGAPISIKSDGGFVKNGVAIATIENALVYQLLEEGIETKNKLILGAVRHKLIDTFYHSGWANLFGHMEGGHRPDMPYEELYKAQRCFQAIMELTFLLRDITDGPVETTNMRKIVSSLSENMLKNFYDISGTSNIDNLVKYLRTKPGVYAELLWQVKSIKYAFGTIVENTEQYKELAFEELFKDLKISEIIKIEKNEYIQVRALFSDLKKRVDFTVQDSFRVAVFRLYQSLLLGEGDEKTHDTVFPEVLKEKLNLEKLNNFNGIEGLRAAVEHRTESRYAALKTLVANIYDLKSAMGGAWKKQNQFTSNNLTDIHKILVQVISLSQVYDLETLELLKTEESRVGSLPDRNQIDSFLKYVYEKQPDVLEKVASLLNSKSKHELLKMAKILNIAEFASQASVEATKDIIPNRISSTQKVNFENDALPNACFAKACRMRTARATLASLFGLDVDLGKLGTMGALEFMKETIKGSKEKVSLLFSKEARAKDRMERERMEQLIREYMLETGHAVRGDDGRIITPLDEDSEIRTTKIRPKFTLRGLIAWFKWSSQDFNGIQYRIDLPGLRFRSKEIARRMDIGRRVKSELHSLLNERYGDGTPVSDEIKAKYNLPGNSQSLETHIKFVDPISGQKAILSIGRCNMLFIK